MGRRGRLKKGGGGEKYMHTFLTFPSSLTIEATDHCNQRTRTKSRKINIYQNFSSSFLIPTIIDKQKKDIFSFSPSSEAELEEGREIEGKQCSQSFLLVPLPHSYSQREGNEGEQYDGQQFPLFSLTAMG